MDALPKLSPAQSLLLRTAARRPDGRVIPPDTLRGGARVKVLTALLQRGWIEPADDGHVMTDAGYAAIGQLRPVPLDDVQPMDSIGDLQLLEGIPVRPGTKLATLVMALRRPQGATSLQLMLSIHVRVRVCAPHGKLRQPVSDASAGAQRLVGRFLQPSQRIGCKPAPVLSFLSWPFFVWPGCKPANRVRTKVRTICVPRLPAQARVDAACCAPAHTAGCELQTLQTLFSGQTVAQCCARAPRIAIWEGRTPFAWGICVCADHNNRR